LYFSSLKNHHEGHEEHEEKKNKSISTCAGDCATGSWEEIPKPDVLTDKN